MSMTENRRIHFKMRLIRQRLFAAFLQIMFAWISGALSSNGAWSRKTA